MIGDRPSHSIYRQREPSELKLIVREARIPRMRGNEKVHKHLADALKAELTAINRYFLHSKMCDNGGTFGSLPSLFVKCRCFVRGTKGTHCLANVKPGDNALGFRTNLSDSRSTQFGKGFSVGEVCL